MSVVHDGFPLPDLSWEPGRPFWEAAARSELSLPRCVACTRFNWYPQPTCRFCGGDRFAWEVLSGRARLFTWARVNRPFLPAFTETVPFVTALVTIAEDDRVRLATRLVGIDGEPDIGMELAVTFAPLRFADTEGEALAPLFTRP